MAALATTIPHISRGPGIRAGPTGAPPTHFSETESCGLSDVTWRYCVGQDAAVRLQGSELGRAVRIRASRRGGLVAGGWCVW